MALTSYTLTVSSNDMALIWGALAELPAKNSRLLLNSLQDQVTTQEAAAAAPAQAETSIVPAITPLPSLQDVPASA